MSERVLRKERRLGNEGPAAFICLIALCAGVAFLFSLMGVSRSVCPGLLCTGIFDLLARHKDHPLANRTQPPKGEQTLSCYRNWRLVGVCRRWTPDLFNTNQASCC
jgi:hypothetical protein